MKYSQPFLQVSSRKDVFSAFPRGKRFKFWQTLVKECSLFDPIYNLARLMRQFLFFYVPYPMCFSQILMKKASILPLLSNGPSERLTNQSQGFSSYLRYESYILFISLKILPYLCVPIAARYLANISFSSLISSISSRLTEDEQLHRLIFFFKKSVEVASVPKEKSIFSVSIISEKEMFSGSECICIIVFHSNKLRIIGMYNLSFTFQGGERRQQPDSSKRS